MLFSLIGCAYEGGTDDYIDGYVLNPPSFGYGFGSNYRNSDYNDAYAGISGRPYENHNHYYCLPGFHCTPDLSMQYGYGGSGYGRLYYGGGYYLSYGRVDPDKQLKRERKQQRKALKRLRKAENKALSQERKYQKRELKQQRRLAKRQLKQQRRQAKTQRKWEKRQRKRQERLNR